ncbi:MAG: GyrI-like domain-containing protein [Anaerolineae bacterium]|nr:GyrI-like domain-containing protein [Anaerolineae bacterium]
MIVDGPKLEQREAQPYVAIRTQVTMGEMGSGIIPQLHGEVVAWLLQHDAAPSGPPLIRYRVIDMMNKLDIELGWPVASAMSGDGRVLADSLPAGRYASLVYTDVRKGIEGNKALIDWAREKGLEWDHWEAPGGDAFGSRVEFFLTNPDDEPDMAKWETEVAIRVADEN